MYHPKFFSLRICSWIMRIFEANILSPHLTAPYFQKKLIKEKVGMDSCAESEQL